MINTLVIQYISSKIVRAKSTLLFMNFCEIDQTNDDLLTRLGLTLTTWGMERVDDCSLRQRLDYSGGIEKSLSRGECTVCSKEPYNPPCSGISLVCSS